jgi:peptide/nickel transport system permease protein
MRRILARRLLSIPATLLVVSMAIYGLTAVLPGNIGRTILGREASEETVAQLNHELGLDRPLVQQYGSWLGNFLRGRWGTSYATNQAVRDVVMERLGRSLLLAGFAFALLVPISLGIGTAAAFRRGTRFDRVITMGSLSVSAIPEFVTGVVLLIVFGVNLPWFPTSATAPDGSNLIAQLHRLVLPASALLLAWAGYVGRIARASTIATLDSDYVRTARIKGVSRSRLIRKHILRNSLVPPTTVLGVSLGAFLGGLTVVESLFNYKGVGSLFLQASIDKDIPVLQALAAVIGLFSMLCVLATDLVYALLDPRVRMGEAR